MRCVLSELADNFRARVLETLELVADVEAQRQYQASVPCVDVPGELFNQWDDFYHPTDSQFRAGFNDAELDALRRFDLVLNDVSDETRQQLPPLDEFVRTAAWQRLSDAAGATLRDLTR